jgi:predicted  nucleic acid-binding Zn-ribbon protein
VIQAKATSVDKAMYGGTVSNVRELQAMGDEVKSLQRRISQLEDLELEVMERIEPVEAEMAQLSKERADKADEAERLRAEVTVNEAEIDGELERVAADRQVAAAEIPDGLLAEYDRLRRQLGGIGVARLVNGQCGGCHLKLSAVELDRLRRQAGDALVHCDECGRLLVR